jgi:hypothetical protein
MRSECWLLALGGGRRAGCARGGPEFAHDQFQITRVGGRLQRRYVLDASFPSSGGINPSLTSVANSLRASDKIAQRL